jgi:hypothetical protein
VRRRLPRPRARPPRRCRPRRPAPSPPASVSCAPSCTSCRCPRRAAPRPSSSQSTSRSTCAADCRCVATRLCSRRCATLRLMLTGDFARWGGCVGGDKATGSRRELRERDAAPCR